MQLKATKENGGKRCEAKRYDHGNLPEENTPEYKRCLNLQKQLGEAVRSGDNSDLAILLEAGANVNGAYYNEYVPLGVAVMAGRAEAVRFLIENGAEVNPKYKWDATPLHQAAIYNFVDIARILIENGANVCARMIDDVAGRGSEELVLVTPLEVANAMGHREMTKLLHEAGSSGCP
ncbi:MAG: ankyrin repeat domain-containing protein [Acidobacteria bacterium]|nr:ankyrin repeat domain-containing protein [Acidobacteriota bacterium]